MKQSNPFSLSFGRMPKTLIRSIVQFNEIKDVFLADNPMSSAFMITGVRGSGKTVLLTRLAEYFAGLDDWIVAELNPELDMLEYLASNIYEQVHSRFRFLKKEFSFSFQGISFKISGERPVSNVITLLENMLDIIRKQGKKILICIDDISNSPNVKAFTQQYQIFIRKGFPLYFLMTGLFENVRSLQNEKSLTFLYRAPRINIAPLDMITITETFESVFGIERSEAVKMAKLTKGYAFAFQVLGYLLYERGEPVKLTKKALTDFDMYLREYVYEKIYSDLPDKEKVFVKALAESSGNTSEAAIISGINKQSVSQYRDKLIKKGLIIPSGRGRLAFALPRFEEYITIKKEFE